MTSNQPIEHLSPEMRAAISSFLNDSESSRQPFDVAKAMAALRRVFPDLDISDADLADAITSEALTAGLDIEYGSDKPGGAQDEAERQRADDTVGTRRRAKETADRNRLV